MNTKNAMSATPVHAIVLPSPSMFPLLSVDQISLSDANKLLIRWGHHMGPLKRGNQGAICHAKFSGGEPIAVTTISHLPAYYIGGCDRKWNRDNTCELSRLCESRPRLCRSMLRDWCEELLPLVAASRGWIAAMSYQDRVMHKGTTYRFDGWTRIGYSNSGKDTRSGRPGRKKAICRITLAISGRREWTPIQISAMHAAPLHCFVLRRFAMSRNIGTLRERIEKLRDAIDFVERRVEPDPDCRLCVGKGRYKVVNNPNWETVFRCECTIVCQCGEERPNNLQSCQSPGCKNQGCDACDEIEWCCDEHDEANGDYFCSECR